MNPHYWRTTQRRGTIGFGVYYVHSGWCGSKSFSSNNMTTRIDQVKCGRCKRTTKYLEDKNREGNDERSNG